MEQPLEGFTGFADVSGRGQLILDGDPLLISSFADSGERQSALNLFVVAGAPIAIADHPGVINDGASFFQNPELLALRREGLVGKPVFDSSHGFEYDPTSRDPERWVGQLPDGSWAVALFNRQDGPGPRTQSIDFSAALGFSGPAAVRDLWAHQDLGSMTRYQVTLAPHASVLLSVVPQGPARYLAEVGAWAGSARFENTFGGHSGTGYVTGLDTVGSSVAVAVAVGRAGRRRLLLPRRQRLGRLGEPDRAGPRPGDRHRARRGGAARARHADMDRVADRPGHRGDGARYQSRGVQCRDPRTGAGQHRLPHTGLSSSDTAVGVVDVHDPGLVVE